MGLNSASLALLEPLLRRSVAPHAEKIDRQPEALRTALQELGRVSLLALRVPQTWGGAEVDETTFRYIQEQIARYSGALAFLQAQHQSAGSMLARSENKALQQTYLPCMGAGEALVGISFAHLRRDPSPVQAIAVPGGYQLQGVSPWVTGWGFFQTFIVAAALPDGRAVYGMVPFQSSQQSDGSELLCSEPMPLAVVTSTRTVTVQFNHWFLPTDQVVAISPLSAQAKSDRLNVLQHSFLALGCARAGLDILAMADPQQKHPFIRSAFESLNQELLDCRQAIFSAKPSVEVFAEQANLRAWAIELAVRCAHAAVVVSRGAANTIDHPAQRVYREALLFSVSGQTTDIMAATLDRLTNNSTQSIVANGKANSNLEQIRPTFQHESL
ncbi:MAG: acyl-CoA/acyl-ACP dehydrogenase [Scytolyngbya sp. HA4215-MV1]|jgi:alkylation response protein AidB-like acyl-CoA dehydrogenase|nr:acyl-CoA/acyl-ACP dehydrogenase [Scytolyngbya sp. HA4215-MV1]